MKIVIDSSQNLYLESFQISKQLSEDRFRHYAIKKDEYLFDKIPNFWEGVEATLAFDAKSQTDYYSMYDSFQYQFDDVYYSGSAATEDTWYSEEYEYSAPLHINKNALPKAFIILRVDGPGLSDGNSPYNFRSEVLNKWKIVTFFDLTTSNNFGTFLNKQLSHPFYPETPTFINYEEIRFSIFSGIDYNLTGYAQKSLDFDPIKSLNTRVFELEENITNKWRDLGLIYPNILNLKFLFDDTPATPTSLRTWSINRYMGFYLDDIEQINSVSPYKPFNLKKTKNEDIESLTPLEVSEMPYVLNNTIVQDISGRRYTFDPIEGDWKDTQQYWIEWLGKYYLLVREINDNVNIIGQYKYKIISDVNITYTAPSSITNPELINQYTKVLLNELSTLKYQIEVLSSVVFENISATNVIQNVNSTYTTLTRLFQQYLVNGQLVWGFRIQLTSDVNNNLFDIPNFDSADLYYMEINGVKSLIKQYPSNIPNIGGLFYLQTDHAINVNARLAEQWINNGNASKDPLYYSSQDIEIVAVGQNPIFYNIYRAAFTDVKDFDFTRMDTHYSKYEYEKNDTLHNTLEMKLYAKERRPLAITMYQPIEINSKNFTNTLFHSYINSDPLTYAQWTNQYTQPIQRSPIGSEVLPVRMYFENFIDYANFKYTNIVTGTTYYVNNIAFTETLNTYKAKMPLYITPTRQQVLDVNNNPAIDPDTGLKLWQTDINGDYIYTPDTALKKVTIPNNREYYREEGYIYLQSDVDPVKTIDFLTDTEPSTVKPTLTFDNDFPMARTMQWSPYKKSIEDPNQQIDPPYLPVTSEYITSEEIWEIRNNVELSPIWDKNQHICKWGFMNSLDTHDYAYRLTYDLEVSGLYNNSCNPFNQLDFAARRFRDLDFFYRCGIDTNFQNLNYFSLHLKEPFFDYDKYFNNTFDYFDYVFHSDYLTLDGINVYKKYSVFDFGDATEGAFTLFKGIKWRIYDVADVIFDKNYPTQQFVEDYNRIKSSTYNGYKFSIVMGRKLSTFKNLPGDNDGDFGIDIVINEVYKNITMFLYFETDQLVTFGKTANNTTIQVNLETADIDSVYEADQIASESVDANLWQNGQLKINGTQSIGDVRIRDLKLFNILAILNEKNYSPVNGSGRQPVRYVRISTDNSVKVMTTVNTDFVLDAELPLQFLIKEKTSTISTTHPINLDINNSIKNTIVLDDDPNSPTNDPTKTSTGVLVNTILDINSWDGMPAGRVFQNSNPDDTRFWYELDTAIDPEIYRHSGPYAPIFTDLNLFRPSSYWTLTNSNTTQTAPVLSAKNWKFYDDFSDNQSTGPNVFAWGYLPEIIFSKVNRQGNVLKLALDSDTKTKSIYPMVDEYGYDFGARYIFQSTWDRNFFLESRLIVLSKNTYPNLAGYTVFLDGYTNYLKINDNIKFNIIPSGYSSNAIINPGDNITLPSLIQTEIDITSLDASKETRFFLIDTKTLERSTEYFFTPNGITPGATNIVADSFVTNITFNPNNISPTSIRIQSSRLVKYEVFFYSNDAANLNGHTYLLNRESAIDNTIFASAHLTVQPINGQIMFTMVTNTRGTILYDYFIPSNVPREKFLKEFSISKFTTDSNVFLNPDYQITNVTGDINNLSFNIVATVAGPTFNFTINNLTNAIENTAMHVNAPVQVDYVEKAVTSELQFIGQNNTLTQFTNKCIRSFTVEFWIKADGFRKDFETIMYKGSADLTNSNLVNDFSWIIRRHNDTSKVEFVTQSYIISDSQDLTTIVPFDAVTQTGTPIYENILACNTDIDDGENHYIAFIFDAVNKKKYIYVDQTLDAVIENENLTNVIIDADPNIEDKNWPILIASDYQNGVLNFRGSIDELRIWNYARSAAQIQSNYNLRVNPFSYLDPANSLVAYYRFDEQAGVLEIKDYSEAIFELERVNIASQTITSNGVQNTILNTSTFLQNEVSLFTKTPIRVTDVAIKWLVSGANIQGISDERYTVALPLPTSKTTIADLPVVITPRSKFAGIFEPSVEPAPRPAPPVPNVPPVKVVTISPHLTLRPKPLKLRYWKRPYPTIRFSFDPEKRRIFDGLDRFNIKWSYLREENSEDDIVRLYERDQILDEQPINYLNNATPISYNAQDKRVTFSQNKPTGVTSTYNSLVFKPINNLLRRV